MIKNYFNRWRVIPLLSFVLRNSRYSFVDKLLYALWIIVLFGSMLFIGLECAAYFILGKTLFGYSFMVVLLFLFLLGGSGILSRITNYMNIKYAFPFYLSQGKTMSEIEEAWSHMVNYTTLVLTKLADKLRIYYRYFWKLFLIQILGSIIVFILAFVVAKQSDNLNLFFIIVVSYEFIHGIINESLRYRKIIQLIRR